MVLVLFNDDWKWSGSDISKELPVGKEVSATAVYTGEDANNYEETWVVFKITRKACTHPHTAERSTPLHPALPADTVEIPTAQTVMKHFPMVIPFLHTAFNIFDFLT